LGTRQSTQVQLLENGEDMKEIDDDNSTKPSVDHYNSIREDNDASSQWFKCRGGKKYCRVIFCTLTACVVMGENHRQIYEKVLITALINCCVMDIAVNDKVR
jgi:hypothetical protein